MRTDEGDGVINIRGRHDQVRIVKEESAAVRVHDAELRNVDFSAIHFLQFSVMGRAEFVDCNFAKCRFDRALFSSAARTLYRRCRFDRATFKDVNLGPARFEMCEFTNTVLSGWFCTVADFVDCRFSGRIEHTKFFGKPFGPWAQKLDPPKTINEFRGNDFSQAGLIDTGFVMGIDLTDQRLPSDGYLWLDQLASRTSRAFGAIGQWTDLDARREALALLQGLRDDAANGQQQALLRPDDFTHVRSDVRDRVMALLAAE